MFKRIRSTGIWPTVGRRALCLWLILYLSVPDAIGCPFCGALAASFREELSQLDYVALAQCTHVASKSEDVPIHTFRMTKVYGSKLSNGQAILSDGSVVRSYSSQVSRVGESVLMFGIGEGDQMDWAPSEPLSSTAIAYVDSIVKLTKQEADANRGDANQSAWIDLHWHGLVSTDDWVRRDSYNALATVSLEHLRPWVKNVKVEEVKKRLAQPDAPVSHRRFYWTIMGLCGSESELTFVRETIFSKPAGDDSNTIERDRIGMDAAISCFLLLGGQDALDEVTQRFLKNPRADLSARFSALSAIRVHLEEFAVLDKKQLCASLAEFLNDSAFADVVIPDLARRGDWTHIAKLLSRFKNIEKHEQYMRVPIINYLRRCPLPDAKAALAECRKLDPDAFRMAEIILPIGTPVVDDK